MPLPADFDLHRLYAPRSSFVHDVLRIDPEEHVIEAVMHTTDLGALVEDQIVRPSHPKHVPGAAMIQATGTLGSIHAVYVLGLTADAGWSGFGTHMKEVRFGALGVIGPDVHLYAKCTRHRKIRGTWFTDYTFRFTQGDKELYRSLQTAGWVCKDQSPVD